MSTEVSVSTEELFDLVHSADERPDLPPGCDRKYPEKCDREAVYTTIWGPDLASGSPCTEGHFTRQGNLCLLCYDYYTQPAGLIVCAVCAKAGVQSFIRIVRSDPIRRG